MLTGLLVQGFNPAEVPSAYGDTLTFWDWRERKVTQSIKLGADGLIPLARPKSEVALLYMIIARGLLETADVKDCRMPRVITARTRCSHVWERLSLTAPHHGLLQLWSAA